MLAKRTINLIFILAFLLISLLVVVIINNESKSRIDESLKSTTKQVYHDYDVFFKGYEKFSKLIFDTKINKPQILKLLQAKKRKELENFLNDEYKILRKYNVAQLHFHTKNNISFLRMHRPLKFGDDLTHIRSTVNYTNQNKKFIAGFEEGRIFNGFRFVFPLAYKDQYLGSVEISFSGLFFIEDILKNYNVYANLLISKDVVDEKVFKNEQNNYVKSPFDKFYFQASILKSIKKQIPHKQIYFKDTTIVNNIQKDISKGEPFSIYDKRRHLVSSFIPLKNPVTNKVVAAIWVDTDEKTIKRHLFNMLVIQIVIIVLLALVIFFLYKIYFFQRDLKKTIKEKTKELNELNDNLQLLVEKEILKNKEKDELMITQSRHAAMGEMISMIAHQWRQPIAVVSMAANNILIDLELGMISEDELKDLANDVLEQTNHLSKTIDDFRDFFKPGKKKELIKLNSVIEESLNIIVKSLENNNINIVKDLKSIYELNTFSRELLQVILNILKNAKEALIEVESTNKQIKISTYDQEGFGVIEIEDNGNGVDETIKKNIFQPYFSTKDEKAGTGLGLYMSKTIIEKHIQGSLTFENTQDGVCFTIKVPKKSD